MFFSFTKLLAEHYHYGWNISMKGSKLDSKVYIKTPADSAYLRNISYFICSYWL